MSFRTRPAVHGQHSVRFHPAPLWWALPLLIAPCLYAQDADRHQQPRHPPATSGFQPRMTVAGSFVGRLDDRTVTNDDGDRIDDRFHLREVHLDLRAPIDDFAEGVLIVAGEAETPGEFEFGVEEGYVVLERWPGLEQMPLGLRLKAGRFRPAVGGYNRLHTHDLPQTTRPFSFQSFFGEEGYVADGLEVGLRFTPREQVPEFGATLTLVNGGGLPASEDNDGEDLAVAARVDGYLEWGVAHDVEIGLSAHRGRRDAAGSLDALLSALDVTYRWRSPLGRGAGGELLIGAEYYRGEFEDAGAADRRAQGGFAYADYRFDEKWSLGARFDYSESPVDPDLVTRSTGLFAAHAFSESLRMRAGWERFSSDDPALDGLDTFWIESTFLFGAHPAHPRHAPHVPRTLRAHHDSRDTHGSHGSHDSHGSQGSPAPDGLPGPR